ncbi:hypothetical protein FLX56_16520 [Synechococcus moorigangaii CMS01]|nr:hypothetical protein [Synechococcus moorigangaii CMS01]
MKSTQGIGIKLLDGLWLGLLVLLSGNPGAIATPTPTESMACPEGWTAQTQPLHPHLKICFPKQMMLMTLPHLPDLHHQPARVQVQQLRIIQTNHDGKKKTAHQNVSRTSVHVYQHMSR